MSKSKYINTFNTTADYNNYIESAVPEFPNVGYDKEAGKVNIRRQSPNNYQIWGTTTATSNFNIELNRTDIEVTVDPDLGEFYLTGWTGTLNSLKVFCYNLSHITSIKKFALDTSNVTSTYQFSATCRSLTLINLSGCDFSNVTDAQYMFSDCSSLETLYLNGCDFSNVTSTSSMFYTVPLKDVYIDVEATLMKLTNDLASQGDNYIPSSATIHYNGTDYKWQNNAWTPQS